MDPADPGLKWVQNETVHDFYDFAYLFIQKKPAILPQLFNKVQELYHKFANLKNEVNLKPHNIYD